MADKYYLTTNQLDLSVTLIKASEGQPDCGVLADDYDLCEVRPLF